MVVCPDCATENPDGFRLCGMCGATLQPAASEPIGARKTVTVLCCDLVDSTQLGEALDPEVLRALLDRYFAAMRAALERHGGTVEKYVGDAVFAVFGVPVLHEDDALRAVRAALDMREALTQLDAELRDDFGVELQARWGISTGDVLVPAGGGRGVILGGAGNIASRLQAVGGPGDVVVGETTHALTGHALRSESLGLLPLKGVRAPVEAWRVLGVEAGAEIARRRHDHRLVGRERELRLLIGAFERAVEERRCGLVTVLGFPGIGKSRLVGELVDRLSADARVLVGRCLSYGEGITYWPLAEMVREAAGADVRAGLSQLLGGEPEGDDVAALVASVVGAGEAAGSGEEAFWAIRRLVERLAAERPLVLVFEDIHWAEPTLLDLIESLAERVRERPVLVVCLARPELLDVRSAWGGGRTNALSLLLEALSEHDARELLLERLGGRQIAPEVRARITETAHGVPLFLEQMVAMLDDGRALAAEDVPPVIQSLLAARLERLGEAERHVLGCASVEGERFHLGALRSVLDGDVDASVRELERRELVRAADSPVPGERALRFAHGLIRDVAYERLPKQERARLHERLAGWLAEREAGDELVGYHLERAYRLAAQVATVGAPERELAGRAGALLAAAGRRAYERADYAATANLLGRAAELLPRESPERLRLLPDLGFVLGEIDVPRAESVLADAIETVRAAGDRRAEWELVVIRSRNRLYSDPGGRPLAAVLEEAERAAAELEALGDARGLASALILCADLRWMRGEVTRAGELDRRAAAASTPALAARALEYAGWALVLGDTPLAEVERTHREMLAQVGRDRVAHANLMASLGWCRALQGAVAEGRETAHRARDLLDELGIAQACGAATMTCGYIELLDLRLEDGERELARAAVQFDGIGDNWFLSTAVVDRALALCALGRHAEAVVVAEHSRLPHDAEWVVKWNHIQALACAARGAWEDALEHAGVAVSAAVASDFLEATGAVLRDRAAILDGAGRPSEAAVDLAAALRAFERKGAVLSAQRTRALIAARGVDPAGLTST